MKHDTYNIKILYLFDAIINKLPLKMSCGLLWTLAFCVWHTLSYVHLANRNLFYCVGRLVSCRILTWSWEEIFKSYYNLCWCCSAWKNS